MAKPFNLTVAVNLQGPNNLKPIVSKIKKEIGSIKTSIDLDIKTSSVKNLTAVTSKLKELSSVAVSTNASVSALNTRINTLASSFSTLAGSTGTAIPAMNKVSSSVGKAKKNISDTTTAIEEFGKQSGLAIKRFLAFSTVSSVIYGLSNAINAGYKEFINFDKEIVRLSQVTGQSTKQLGGITKEITRLSTTLGVASSDLLNVSTTLAQAGFSATETKVALEALAKSSLAPSFENITDTTEGAIAAMRQFGIAADELDSALGSINAVAAKFAVEASDIITAIQRTGGVFANASRGVSEGTDALNEFIAVFTSVRATTRESAETIATGLRTIFTRIQRSKTIDELKKLGIELRDVEGKFVGPYEATRRLAEGLNRIDPRSAAFAKISEELGGFRQIGKVIPLIQQFAVAQDALKTAQKGSGSLAKDAVIAQQSLAVQFAKTRESFVALIRDIGNSGSFKALVTLTLTLTNGLIGLASS
ncbi:phage tail tape measure protein, partial [bacterium]|nr:phage tail tape measure protein [bacterium]